MLDWRLFCIFAVEIEINRTMKLRVLFNYLLVRLGIRKILPADVINGKEVRECGDKLIAVEMRPNIILSRDDIVGRERVVKMLYQVADALEKQNLKLHIYQIYRSPEEQSQRHETVVNRIRQSNPELSEEEVLRQANRWSAGVGGGHQSGGAVDLTICDMDGNDMDMGTEYRENNEKTKTENAFITSEQREYRRSLKDAMRDAGFVNYPAEWWHYCYGDRMWAAYSHRKFAIFGDTSCLFTY